MLSIATQTDRFSIVTVFDPDRATPAWESMLGLPGTGRQAVPLAVRSAADRKIWAARLDRAVQGADRAVLLVADGVGCAASAWWARLSPAHDVARIAGALLFAPSDRDHATPHSDLFASPRTILPFPSLVIQPEQARQDIRSSVDAWGSRVVFSGRQRQPLPGATAWVHAQQLFLRLTSRVVAHEVERAEALVGHIRPR